MLQICFEDKINNGVVVFEIQMIRSNPVSWIKETSTDYVWRSLVQMLVSRTRRASPAELPFSLDTAEYQNLTGASLVNLPHGIEAWVRFAILAKEENLRYQVKVHIRKFCHSQESREQNVLQWERLIGWEGPCGMPSTDCAVICVRTQVAVSEITPQRNLFKAREEKADWRILAECISLWNSTVNKKKFISYN